MTVVAGLLANAPLPTDDPFVIITKREGEDANPNEGRLTRPAIDYLTALVSSVSSTASRISSIELSAQSGDIAATDISSGDLAAGMYRLWYYLSITAAGALGTLTLTLDWTEDGIARTFTSTALDETNTSKHTEGALLIRIDGASPVRYATAGATFGVGYTLTVQLESVL